MTVAALVLACASGCASNTVCERSSEPDQSERCAQTGSGAEAAATAGVAAGSWAVVGCRQNGCNLPYECNQETGFCERMMCSEAVRCPPSFACDLERRRCK